MYKSPFGSPFGGQQWQQRWQQQLQNQRHREAGCYWLQQQRRQNGGYTPSGGSCFVATASFGDPDHPTVVTLRGFRDAVLTRFAPGRRFIAWYYSHGPGLARLLDRFPALKWPARLMLTSFSWVYLPQRHCFDGIQPGLLPDSDRAPADLPLEDRSSCGYVRGA